MGSDWFNLFSIIGVNKLAVPIFLASFLFNKQLPIQRKEIILSLLMIFFCFFLVYRQPDLGTALIVACSGLFVLFLSGLSWVLLEDLLFC